MRICITKDPSLPIVKLTLQEIHLLSVTILHYKRYTSYNAKLSGDDLTVFQNGGHPPFWNFNDLNF